MKESKDNMNLNLKSINYNIFMETSKQLQFFLYCRVGFSYLWDSPATKDH